MTAELIEDVPSEQWLSERIEDAASAGRNRWGVPAMNRITAYYRDPVMLPTSLLSGLRGQRDEQGERRDPQRIAELATSYRTHGVREDRDDTPYVEVAYNGEAWVREGNHRIMAARAAGVASLAVQVRYFDGGQRSPGPLAPMTVAAHAAAGDGTPSRPFDFSRDPAFHEWIYGERDPDPKKAFSRWLFDHRDSFVQLYHGTASHLASAIRTNGLRPTSLKRRNSLQSSNGYVSLSVYPGSAFEFGKTAGLNKAAAADGAHVIVYPVVTTIRALRPDHDQLANKRHYGALSSVGTTLADSLMHGSGARVRGTISPWSLGQPDRFTRDGRKIGVGDEPAAFMNNRSDTTVSDELKPFRVSLHEEKGDTFTMHFECMAEDACHAEEQALDAYPNGDVVHIAVMDEAVEQRTDGGEFTHQHRRRASGLAP